jgi:hypothetical protein
VSPRLRLGFDFPMSRPPHPLLSPSHVGVDLSDGHPKSSQIGVGLAHGTLIGVGLKGFGFDLAKGQWLRAKGHFAIC